MNIYLINSLSVKLIDENIKKIIGKNTYLSINLNESKLENLLEESSYRSFGEKKYIVARGASFFSSKNKNEEDDKLILKYLENPNPDTTLIFVSSEIDSRKKIVKLIKEKYEFIDLKLDYKNIYDHINNYVKKNNYIIDYKFTGYLVNLYGLNLDLILNELDKLFLYFSGNVTLTMTNSKKIISVPLDGDSFHFIKKIVDKNINDIFTALEDLKIYKVDMQSILILLGREFRLMFYVKKLFAKGSNMSEIMKTLKLQEWQVNKVYKSSLLYNEKELLHHIKNIAIYDEKIKMGLIDKTAAINLLLLDIIT